MQRCLYSLLFIVCFTSTYSQDWTAKIDSVLTILAQDELFHGQVLFEENDQVILSEAYGVSENRREISNETPLAIASVSKAFTAFAVLMLIDREMLAFESELIEFFPELPYDGVTIRSMLNMTSGLPRFQATIEQHGKRDKTYSTLDIIELVSKYKPKAMMPGDEFAYNGDNYTLLAAIVEKMTGESFVSFVGSNIFRPLGMTHSYFFNQQQSFEGSPLSSKNGPPMGEGHIYSTAQDLMLFINAITSSELVPEGLLKQSFEMTPLSNGDTSNYGFSWRIHKAEDTYEVYIVGDGQNTRSSIQYYPVEHKTFIYIHNISGSDWKGVYGAIRNIWEQKPFDMPRKRTIYQINTSLYKNYVGEYLSEAFGLLHISVENNKLYLRPDPIPGKEELIPSSDTTFYFGDQALEWEFFLDEQGSVLGLGLKGKPETIGPKQ